MSKVLGILFLLLSLWQFWMSRQAFRSLKKEQQPSAFAPLGIFFSLLMAVIFFSVFVFAFF